VSVLTTYDDIWQTFRDNCGVDKDTLPQDDEGKYILIRNGIRKYNTWIDFEDKLIGDDALEIINKDIDDNRILILAYCIKHTVLENALTEYEQVWQPFTKEIGQKFYKDQINGRETRIQATKQEILQHISNIEPQTYGD
jgi:hypothetical protein